MIIGARIKQLRERKGLTQGDIEERTGLKRCYVSRVENGHTVPAIHTLEKITRALGVPLYQIFYNEESAGLPEGSKRGAAAKAIWEKARADARLLTRFRRLFGRVREQDRQLLLTMAQQMAEANRVLAEEKQSRGGRRSRS